MSQRTIKPPAIKGTISVESVMQVVAGLEAEESGASGPRPAKKRAASAAFMKTMTPSVALAAIVGNKPMSRPEVTKKIWEYIKKNGLQDQTKKTMINADVKLKEIFKKSQASMFEMTKVINSNLK